MRSPRFLIALFALIVICLMAITTAQMRSSEFTNSPPVAVDDNYTVHGSLVLKPLLNDSDPDGEQVVFDGIASSPQHGALVGTSPGELQYTANDGYVGPDSFSYRIRDGAFARASATVFIDVVNQAPIAAADSYTVHGSLVIKPPLNDTDPDGDPIIFEGLLTGPQHGELVGVNPGGEYQYTANPGYVGTDSFTYKIRDNLFAHATGTVNLTVVNQTPIANPDSYTVRGGLVLKPPLNDTDPDGDPLVFDGIVTGPQHGTLVGVNPGGEYQYTANAGYVGSDSFTYKIRDNLFASAIGTATLYVIGDGENDGECPCHAQVAAPINVTNGNMYLQQGDYDLPGAGPAISITRTYNSNSQRVGLFGRGWSSEFDESIQAYDNNLVRLNRGDGRAIYLGRASGSSGILAPLEGDFHGSVVKNASASFTQTMSNGSVRQFNSAGKLVSVSDRTGNQTTLAYDSSGKLTSVTDPFGRVLSFTTNTSGQVLSISDALGIVATYAYGGGGKLLSVTYPDNSRFQLAYDGNNRLTAVSDALGNIVESHTYDSQGRALTSERQGGVEHYSLNYVSEAETDVMDALSHVTKYTIDKSKGRNVVIRVEGLCNCGSSQTQTWTYDNQLNVTGRTDALNHATSFTYDANGNQLTQTDSTGTVVYTYNQFAQPLTRADQLNHVTTNTYDGQGNLLTITDALNNTTSFVYNSRGQIMTATDARGKATNLVYDTLGNLVQRRDANSITTFFFYDARGRLTKVRDGLSRSTLYSYDPAGRVNRITHPDLSFVSFAYDLAGRPTTVTDERGNATNYTYDSTYRLITLTDALGHAANYGYDGMSNLTDITDTLNRVTQYQYDDFNRVKKITYPSAAADLKPLSETLTYDVAGNVIQRTDLAGRVTRYEYDNVNRMTRVTDAENKTTTVQYDSLSRMIGVTDAINQQYQFAYDAVGRQTAMTRAGVSMSYQYDAAGNITQRTDYNGAVTNYAYDNLNRLITINYPTRSVTYAYDPLNNLTRATNENGSVYIGYDNRYRVASFSDPFFYGVSYNYDAAGNRTKLKLNGATYASYTYDAVNRMTNLSDSANLNFPNTYDAVNRLTSRSAPNGVSSTYSYDGLDRLTALTHTAGANTLIANQYTYNDAGSISSWTNATGNHAYAYDAVDRLTSASNSAQPNESYSYDGVGNRLASNVSASYSYQPFNKLTNTATASYAYDNNGNLLSKTDSSGTTAFSWNEENQLTQVILANGLTVTYKYDALGRRIQRTASTGADERYVYDGAEVLLDLNADWSVANTYLNGPGADNHLRQTSATTGVAYFLGDHLGSTAALTNAAGTVLEQVNYDAFGNSAGSSRTRYGFTGRERDPDTKQLYYRARFYDPQVGRFISEDPIGLAGGINSFGYVHNNPQNATDPSGLYEIDVHYYLTYYLAVHSGCFNGYEAGIIADFDQRTDEDDDHAPGFLRAGRNKEFHSFGSHQENIANQVKHWREATSGNGSLSNLGIFFHFFQDSFSHYDYAGNSLIGQARDGYAPDHTNTDPIKSMKMARASLDKLRDFGKEKGLCCRESTVDWAVVAAFIAVGFDLTTQKGRYDNVTKEITDDQLRLKIQILGVPWRSPDGRSRPR